MAESIRTPEFLCWAIERQCPLRELLPENQPEKVERHLRAARFTAEARSEGRVQGDLALSADRTMAFQVSEALVIYGGEEAVCECCSTCPANALATITKPSYAGCYGMLPLPEPAEVFLKRIQDAQQIEPLFPATKCRWYGWWMKSPLDRPQLAFLAEALAAVALQPEFSGNRDLRDFVEALQQCVAQRLPLSAQLYPAGTIAGVWWNLDPHCPRCRAPWQPNQRQCGICHQSNHPADPKKRRVRGTRPYRPIAELPISKH